MTQLRKYAPTLTVLATLLCLAACGIKPGSLEPPTKSGHDEFPHTYPAPDQP